MDPITLGLIIGGGVLSGAGKLLGGFAEARSRFDQGAEAERQAQLRLEKGEFDVQQSQRRFNRVQGEVLAGIGTTGVDVSSFLDVLMDDAAEGALERKAIRWTAANEAHSLRVQARGMRRAGKDSITGAYFGAAGSVVSSIADYRFQSSRASTQSSGVSGTGAFGN